VNLGEVLGRSTAFLERKGVESPRLDAERLLARALGLSRIELYTAFERPLSDEELAASRALVERRGRREPLAYVLGDWDFRRLTLRCDARALVPRPETEILVERALALLDGAAAPRVLDVGTGTGAVALAIAQEHPGAQVTSLDVSPDALALAAENAQLNGLQVELRLGDIRDGLEGAFDLVVSNPPYVTPDEIDELEPEVRDHEPRSALVGPGVPEAVAEQARTLLVPGGWLVVELGAGQHAAYAEHLRTLGFGPTTITPDLSGRERIIEAQCP
jgi:release factor glutamine methyltransferase